MEAKEITQALNHLTIECVGSFLGLELPANLRITFGEPLIARRIVVSLASISSDGSAFTRSKKAATEGLLGETPQKQPM